MAERVVLMHGHRHIDWIGECGGIAIVSAPSPVMEATNELDTYFYIHTLEAGGDGRIRLLAPQRVTVRGVPRTRGTRRMSSLAKARNVMSDRTSRIALTVCASVLLVASLYLARAVFAPVAMSLFAIGVVWPIQKWLEARLPQLAALAVTLLVTVLVFGTLIALSIWALGQVGRWLITNAAHLEALYSQIAGWFEGHGIFVLGLFVERFDVLWLARPFQILVSHARDLVGFSLLVLVFMMLGFLEVGSFREKLLAVTGSDRGARLVALGERMAGKFRRYMIIRTVASIVTGLTVLSCAGRLGFSSLTPGAFWRSC